MNILESKQDPRVHGKPRGDLTQASIEIGLA